MIVVINEKAILSNPFYNQFIKEGVAVEALSTTDFQSWIQYATEEDVSSVEAFILYDTIDYTKIPVAIRLRSNAPIVAMLEQNTLEKTLAFFHSGVDDVLRSSVDVKEIIARIAAITRRENYGIRSKEAVFSVGDIQVFNDGRDPKIKGNDFILPRRERRILEYLVANQNTRVTKTQLFNSIYGLFETEVEENVIESHISKLRKKLKAKFGYDIIDSKRFLGYRINISK